MPAAPHQRGTAALGYGFPRQSVPQGHLLRGADWLGMTGSRGGRLCPPCMTAAPCRAGPVCPAGSNAYAAAGHMGPALQGRCVDTVPYTFNSSGRKSIRQNHNNSPPNFVHLSKRREFRRKRLRTFFEGATFNPYIVNILYTDTLGCLALPPLAAKQMAYLRNLILHGRVLK